MYCFDLLNRNSCTRALSGKAVFICYVSMTTPQMAPAIDRTKTSIIPSSHFFHPSLCARAVSCS